MTRGNAQPRGRHHVGTLAGFKSERVAGFRLECMAGFVGIRNSGGERRFNLALDLDRLEKEIDLRQVSLVVIDPASAYLNAKKGKRIDRNNAGDVRTVLDRLGAFAARHDLGVLAISHLNKSSGAGRSPGSWGRKNGQLHLVRSSS